MKYLQHCLIFLLMTGFAYAQSKLPGCRSEAQFQKERFVIPFMYLTQPNNESGWHNCIGTYTFANSGSKYVGEFQNGKFSGQGSMTFANGDTYTGDWENGARTGQGTYASANGAKYVGGFIDGKFNGQGTWKGGKDNSFIYIGEFKTDMFNGQGSMTYVNGDKYIGEFKDGKFDGLGTLFISNSGSIYLGDFKENKYHGYGKFNSIDGSKYVGQYKEGRRSGLGTLYDSDGKVKSQGLWADNIFVRFELVQVADGANGQSNLRNLPSCNGIDPVKWNNCFGAYTFSSGSQYIGEFKNGNYSGLGTYFFSDGKRYVGQYMDGKRNGEGALYDEGGKLINQGIWSNNTFVRYESSLQTNSPNVEVEMLRAQAEAAKRKQTELEDQLRLTKQQTQATNQTPFISDSDKRIALVVGNANYKTRPLRNPFNDAEDVSKALKATGFQVIDLRDATLQQMRAGVRQFGDRLINNDVGLVYYSGHGIEVKGRNYLIPVNADIMREDEIAEQGLDMSLILEKMSAAGKGVNILIVDACRDDPFGRSFRSSSVGLAQMDAPRGTIIAYATSPGKVAADGDGRNSPYTKNLVKAIQQPNKPIEQVFKEVRRAVQEETKNQQTPWENTSLSGDFYFRVQR